MWIRVISAFKCLLKVSILSNRALILLGRETSILGRALTWRPGVLAMVATHSHLPWDWTVYLASLAQLMLLVLFSSKHRAYGDA